MDNPLNYTEKVPRAEVYEQLRKEVNLMHMKHILEELRTNQRLKIDLRKRLRDVTPAEVSDMLEKLGWESDEYSSNGWEQDTWIPFAHEVYDFCLILAYSGYYWTMELYRSDIDD